MKCMGYDKDEIINYVNYSFSLFLFVIKLNFFASIYLQAFLLLLPCL